jgi:hypothetical protein
MGTDDAGIHTRGDDRDGSTSCSCWDAWRAAICWSQAAEEEELLGWEEASAAFEIWHATQHEEAPSGYEGLDGVHPRDAQKEVGDAG